MFKTFFQARIDRHLLKAEIGAPHMAKVDLRKAEEGPRREEIGRALSRTQHFAGLSLKEFAARLDRDPRQVQRWQTGDERVQLDAIYADRALWNLFIVQLATLSVDIRTETVLRVSVSA